VKRELLKGRETFHLEIPADENNLSDVRDFIADICLRAGFSKRETNNTKLAMDEACTNIIKHAYGDRAGDIRIDVQAEPGSVEINIFDRGRPFEWSKVKDPDLQQYVEIGKKGGLGIYLMNRLMDDLDYSSSDAGNRLFMAKKAGSRAEPLFMSIRPKWTATLRFKFALRATLGLLGLVVFLWIVQYVNQSRDVEGRRRQAWMDMAGFARTLETKAEPAVVLDDPYDPEYMELTDFLIERVQKMPAVRYARVVSGEGLTVASSDIDEFMNEYSPPAGAAGMPSTGVWIEREENGEAIREFHLPVKISREEGEGGSVFGRVVLGVSEDFIESGIYDPRPKTSLMLVGIFLVGVSLIYLLISVFVKPIQALTDGVRAIGEGSLEDEIEIEGPEEIGEIARAFNEITNKFRVAQQSVVEQERMQKEMQVAQEIQHSLLPGIVPSVSGYDIASLYRAAKEVGGDYYDFVSVDEDTLGVVVADVSGKGVPGSLVMTMIRTALRMEARGSHSAADVMARMNDFVTEDMKKGMFVTIFYVILDSKNRVISYSSAGHNPMILFRAETDETFFLNPRGFPVGISLPDESLFRRSIDVEKIKLKKDDMLVIYTDGVTEAMNEQREQYGEERLLSLIKRCGRMSPDEFIDALNEDIRDFTGGYPQNDDITVVAVKEKLMADDVLFGIRKKLLDLVDVEGLTVAEACARMKVSPSTYYRYKKRMTEMGDRGLKNKTLRSEHEIRRVSIEQRKELLGIIRDNPRFGAKRIADMFSEGRDEKDGLNASLVYDELKRMRLNTFEKRVEYLRRNRYINEEEFQALVQGKALPDTPPVPETAGEGREIRETEVPEAPREEEAEERVDEEAPVAAGPSGEQAMEDVGGASRPPRDMERLAGEILREGAAEVEVSESDEKEGLIVLKVRGHLDSSSAGELESFIEKIFERGFSKIAVDLSDVSYISSGGWGIFTGRVRMLREREGDVVLAGMSAEVFDIYELLGFQDIIMHFHNVDEAVDFLTLPFDIRQKRLGEISSLAPEETRLERRISAQGEMPGEEAKEEGGPWTPLRIQAGTVGEHGEITVLNLVGVIDTVSCMKLREVMDDLVDKGVDRFVVDMSLVEYVSSAGWGVFASRIDDVRRTGGDIKIFGMDPEVDNIFHLLGFDVIMRSFSILSEAIEDFRDIEGVAGEAVERSVTEAEAGPAAKGGSGPSRAGEAYRSRRVVEFDVRRLSRGAGVEVLDVSGAIDAATSEEFEGRLDEVLGDLPSCLVLDLSEMIYISSSGWGVIIRFMQRLQEAGGRLALSGMSAPIFKIFRDLGFEPLIPHYFSVEKALEDAAAAGAAPRVESQRRQAAEEPVVDTRDAGERKESAAGRGKTAAGDKRAEKEDGRLFPSLDGAIEPLEDIAEEMAGKLDSELDLSGKMGDAQRDDSRIRDLGWKEYGRRLLEKNRDKRGDGK